MYQINLSQTSIKTKLINFISHHNSNEQERFIDKINSITKNKNKNISLDDIINHLNIDHLVIVAQNIFSVPNPYDGDGNLISNLYESINDNQIQISLPESNNDFEEFEVTDDEINNLKNQDYDENN